MDLNGNILWRAKLAGAVTLNVDDQAMFYGRTKDDMVLLLQRGQVEPSGTLGGATLNYSSTQWDSARLSPENSFLLIGATLNQVAPVTAANDTVVFWGPPGGLQVLLREGDVAPATGGGTYSGTVSGAQNVTALNSSGIAVVKAKVVGGTVTTGVDDDGWLIGSPGGLSWMIREGDLLNGGTVGVGSLGGLSPQIDATGRVIVVQNLSTTLGSNPATTANDETIMLYTPGFGTSILMREGDPAPGSGGTLYGTISASSGWSSSGLSRTNGHVLFSGNLTGGDVVVPTSDRALFAGLIGSGFTRVARESEAAPTGVPGEVYQAFFPNGNYQINDNGTVVFVAQLGPTGMNVYSDVAVFLAKPPYTNPGDVQMILREGQAVAGLPAGWFISNTSGGGMSSSSTVPILNERDEVVVSVAGVGDPTLANWGVPALIKWDAQHPGGRAVYVQGDTFATQVNPAWVTSSAAGLVATSSGDGGSLGWNNNGDFCVKLFSGSENAVVRGHACLMISEPSSVPVAGGVPHNFHVDCGPSQAGNYCFILASSGSTRPGFPSPFGPQTVPLDLGDPLWLPLSINNPNSAVWIGTLQVLDGNGRNPGPASFLMPAGFPMFLGLTLHHAAVIVDQNLSPITTTLVSEPSSVRLY
jgi:hypothetical protein